MLNSSLKSSKFYKFLSSSLWNNWKILTFLGVAWQYWCLWIWHFQFERPYFERQNMQNAHGIGLAFFRTNVKHYWQKRCDRWTSWNGDWKCSTKVRWICFHRIIHKVNAWNWLNPSWEFGCKWQSPCHLRWQLKNKKNI